MPCAGPAFFQRGAEIVAMHDEDEDDRDDPDESDQDVGEDADGSELVPCPYCQEKIVEEAEICPHCGSFISREEIPTSKPRWFTIAVVVTLILVLFVWVIKGW